MAIAEAHQQAQPSRSLSRWMLMGSLNSPLNSSAGGFGAGEVRDTETHQEAEIKCRWDP
ncbi:hypothetical protein KXW16_004906, partial [Aspergillus fumigatus]